MATMFRVTIRNEHDEVTEFDSREPVVHIDIPAGRYLITVRCAGSEPDTEPDTVRQGKLH